MGARQHAAGAAATHQSVAGGGVETLQFQGLLLPVSRCNTHTPE
jgi:hypothetical protein